ncbi:Na+/H+ antiporter subunit E [Phenylobacterium sp.]|uniref:Na+/H+ antiporter subunit E n=1 Tax=Phenylobacterium sp. TaxID=1871053 RepID=UPI00273052AD|nr:Na+/H+ antiporter subunit E [Phenylobacterium sp.]MDP2212876.1 Na+/H+ antiporter subunit E [Phenylobacterium sp.]
MRKPVEALLFLKRFALFFGLWLVLTGAAIDGLPYGLVAAAAAVGVSARLAPPAERPLRLLRLLMLAPGFFGRALAGGVDVASRAFRWRMPLQPGWVLYRPTLPAGTARVVLGGEISLLPGTLVAGEDDGRLLVHCLDTGLPITRQIALEEERLVRAVEP